MQSYLMDKKVKFSGEKIINVWSLRLTPVLTQVDGGIRILNNCYDTIICWWMRRKWNNSLT